MNIDERHQSRVGKINRAVLHYASIASLFSIILKSFLLNEWNPFRVDTIPELIILLFGLGFLLYELSISNGSKPRDERSVILIQNFYYNYGKYVAFLVLLGYISSLAFIRFEADNLLSYPSLFISSILVISFIVYYWKAKKNQIYLFEKYISLSKKEYRNHILKIILKVILLYLFITLFGFLIRYLFVEVEDYTFILLLLIYLPLSVEVVFWIIIISSYEWIHYHESIEEEEQNTLRLLSKTYMIFAIWIAMFNILVYIAIMLVNLIHINLFHQLFIDGYIPAYQLILLLISELGKYNAFILIVPMIISAVILIKSVQRSKLASAGVQLFLKVYLITNIVTGLLSGIFILLINYRLFDIIEQHHIFTLYSEIFMIVHILIFLSQIILIIILYRSRINGTKYLIINVSIMILNDVIRIIGIRLQYEDFMNTDFYTIYSNILLITSVIVMVLFYHSLTEHKILLEDDSSQLEIKSDSI